jgi:hypothetical protein
VRGPIRQAHQQITERVREEDLLDLRCERVAAFVETIELTGQFGDNAADGCLGGQGHGLGVKGGEDGVGGAWRRGEASGS